MSIDVLVCRWTRDCRALGNSGHTAAGTQLSARFPCLWAEPLSWLTAPPCSPHSSPGPHLAVCSVPQAWRTSRYQYLDTNRRLGKTPKRGLHQTSDPLTCSPTNPTFVTSADLCLNWPLGHQELRNPSPGPTKTPRAAQVVGQISCSSKFSVLPRT